MPPRYSQPTPGSQTNFEIGHWVPPAHWQTPLLHASARVDEQVMQELPLVPQWLNVLM